MHGSWKGTFRSPEGVAGGLGLSVAHDSLGQLTLKMSAARPVRAGGARNVLLDGATLRWTQDLSGQRCQATAVLTAATVQVPETLEGRMACEDGELTFTLRKAAE